MRRRVSAAPEILEKADARERKRRRATWRRKGGQQRKRHPHDPPAVVRGRIIERVLNDAGVAAGTVEAFDLLQGARDDTNRRLMYFAATGLLRSYLADAESAAETGWRRLPTSKTQRQRADALDISDKYIRDLNRDLAAAGLLRDGGLHYAGDGARSITRKGKRYLIPLKRRVWWLAPAVAAIVARGEALNELDTKSGNPFPADLLSDQPSVIDPPLSGVCAPSDSPFSLPSSPAALRETLQPPTRSPSCSPVSALNAKRSEGTAVAAPGDLVQSSPQLKHSLPQPPVPERPSAAQRRGGLSFESPTLEPLDSEARSPSSAGAVPSPDPSTVRHQKGGSPPPFTPTFPIAEGVGARHITRENSPPCSPDRAFKAPTVLGHRRGAPGNGLERLPAPRLPRPPRAVSDASTRLTLRRGYAPTPVADHPGDCVCMRCWIAASVQNGTVRPRPHPVGHRCPLCWVWADLTKKQWLAYRDPSKAPPPRPAEDVETLRVIGQLGAQLTSGELSMEGYQRLALPVLEGRALEVSAELQTLGILLRERS
jgi:hypothetical protein